MSKRPPLLSVDEARARLLHTLPNPGRETIPLTSAAGRVLAAPIIAKRAQPPARLSAMDGYAVRREDLGGDLRIVGKSEAGHPFSGGLGKGEAVRILTGAIVPGGADLVIIQEDVDRTGDRIVLSEHFDPSSSDFIRPQGLDFAEGTEVLNIGQKLTPARLALAAASNVCAVDVVGRPRVAIFGSGDELKPPGTEVQTHELVDSASYGVRALVEREGGLVLAQSILPDDAAGVKDGLEGQLSKADLIVLIGGASVGDRDILRPTTEALGAKIHFAGVAVRPGKPTWHARFANGPLVLGLPGNPASALVCAHLFLLPLLRAMQGSEPGPFLISCQAGYRIPAEGGRETYLRGRHRFTSDGALRVEADERQDSSLLTPFAAASVLIRRKPGAPSANEGDRVEVLWLDEFC